MLNRLLPATLGQAKIDGAYMGIHIYIFVKTYTNTLIFKIHMGHPS